MRNKILIIGDYETRVADSCKWDGDLYNLTDYDIVIIDTSSLYKIWSLSPGHSCTIKEWPKKIEANFKYINQKIMESILIDTQIYVLFHPNCSLTYRKGDYYRSVYLDTNDWFPISIETHIENGTTVIPKNKVYQEYLKRLKSWKYYYLPQGKNDESEIKEFHKPNSIIVKRNIIAANKLGNH